MVLTGRDALLVPGGGYGGAGAIVLYVCVLRGHVVLRASQVPRIHPFALATQYLAPTTCAQVLAPQDLAPHGFAPTRLLYCMAMPSWPP